MTKEEIIEMARQAGIHFRELSEEFATGNGDGVEIEQMQAFAKLVIEREREACAKACEEVIFKVKPIYCVVAENCVKVIRARGQE